MTRIKLDENFGRRGRWVLTEGGHDVTTVADEGLCGASDRAVIDACSQEGRALVSLDLDFANPLLFPPQRYRGIAVLRLSARPAADELHDALRILSRALNRQSIDGRLWIA